MNPLPHEVWHLKKALDDVTIRAIPEPEVMPRLATDEEIPSGARQVINKMTKAGWKVEVLYGKHSWPKQAEKVEDADGNLVEKIPFGIVESIVVKGRRGKQYLFAIWMTKPWTKSGDAYSFYTSHFIPDVGKVSSPELKRLIDAPEGGVNDGEPEG